MHAGAGLLLDHLALREGLVLQHEGVAALLAEVDGEGIARPHRLQARVLLETGLGDDCTGSTSSGVRGMASLPP